MEERASARESLGSGPRQRLKAQNLRELHEAETSMDFFRRTVAALGGTKPEAGELQDRTDPHSARRCSPRIGAAPSAWKRTCRRRPRAAALGHMSKAARATPRRGPEDGHHPLRTRLLPGAQKPDASADEVRWIFFAVLSAAITLNTGSILLVRGPPRNHVAHSTTKAITEQGVTGIA